MRGPVTDNNTLYNKSVLGGERHGLKPCVVNVIRLEIMQSSKDLSLAVLTEKHGTDILIKTYATGNLMSSPFRFYWYLLLQEGTE